MTDQIIKCQSIVRRYLSNKNNIYKCLKNIDVIQSFKDEVNGYHMINETHIKESVWEDINANFAALYCKVSDKANGNHSSGKDIKFGKHSISNKTGKFTKTSVNVSSYRLTRVCNNKNHGKQEDFIAEIEKRDSSFDYYSLLMRKDLGAERLEYYWYIIPQDCNVFSPNLNEWEKKKGQRSKNKGAVVGWKSKYMDITFSMSSQLWYRFDVSDISRYEIARTTVDLSSKKLTYADIFKFWNFRII
jgi:hypothetical protein